MISFVNGFLCTCSCDVSKAKRGVDPHQQADAAQNATKPGATTKNGVVTPDKPAVVFGGSLSGVSASAATSNVTPVSAVAPSAPASVQSQAQTVDLLV